MVSENARRLREEKRLTLDEAARLTGVSRSMLAQIEKGDVNPTISMVWKIANGYKVSFTSLVEPARERPVSSPGRRRSACRGRPTGSGPATPCASRRTSPTATGTRGRRRLNSVC